MRKSFEEALADLLAEYRDAQPGELISAMELALYALREQHGGDVEED